MPCSHGSRPVGNLTGQTIESIWNGPAMQDLRARILAGQVHEACRGCRCPYQAKDPAFPVQAEPVFVDEDLISTFDEADYLERNEDVCRAVKERFFDSGLEHFVMHGRAEGRAYRRMSGTGAQNASNAVLSLLEFSQGHLQVGTTPTDLILAVTSICNLDCVMCPHGMGLVERPSHLSASFVKKLGHFIDEASRIVASGVGEPLLAPAFWDLIEAVRLRKDVFVRTNSNGHFLNERNAQRILDSGLTEISVSLDAATSGTYRKIRGGDFRKALRGIATLIRRRKDKGTHRIRVYVNMTLMGENLAEAPRLVRLARLLRVDGVVFTQLFLFGDRPDWRVRRGEWTFVYSEQVPGPAEIRWRNTVRQVREAGLKLGMDVILRDGVASYAA